MLALGETATSAGSGSLEIQVTTLDTSVSLPSHVAQLPLELLQRTFFALVDLYHGELVRSWGRPDWIEITRARPAQTLVVHHPGILYRLVAGHDRALFPASNEHYHPRILGLLGRHADVLNVLNRLCRPSLIESFILRLINVADPIVDLPESLYGRDAPHLRSLTFDSDAYSRVPHCLLANITHFTNDVCISLDRLIQTLETIPQLEVLCIDRNFDNRDSTIDEDLPLLPRTKLQRLSLLCIRDRFPNSFLILSSWIDGPPTLRRHFFWQDDLDVLTQVSWSLSTLLPFIPSESTPGANDGGLKIAQIGGRKSDSFEMRSRSFSGGTSTAVRKDALFLFKIEWSSRNPLGSCFPHPALLCFNPPTIEDLTIAQETGLDDAQADTAVGIHETDVMRIVMRWAELLNNMPTVKTLRLHRGTFACFSVLLVLGAFQGSAVSRLQIFSHLRRIIITNSAVYSDVRVHPDGDIEAGAHCSVTGLKFVLANVSPELMEVVDIRPGLEVVLAGCEVEEKMLDELRKRARVYIGHERVYV